jgi:F-box-like
MVTPLNSALPPLISLLPVETVAQIFSFLPPPVQAEAAATCRLFRDLANVKMRKNEQAFHEYLAQQDSLTDEVVIEGLRRFPGLGRVTIEVDSDKPSQLTGRVLTAIAASCPYLHTLHLETSKVKQFPDLTNLDLEKFARSVSSTLRDVSIAGCPGFTETGYLTLAIHCAKLRRVTIASAGGLSDAFVRTLLIMNPRLMTLDLGGNNPAVTDKALILTSQFGRQLKTFEMRMHQPCFSREAVQCVIKALNQLEHFGLKGCKPPIHPLLPLISQRLPKLRHLCLGSCDYLSAKSIKQLADRCPELETLLLYDCLRPDYVREQVAFCQEEGHFSHLKTQRIMPPLMQRRKISYSARLGDLCTVFTSHQNWPRWLKWEG